MKLVAELIEGLDLGGLVSSTMGAGYNIVLGVLAIIIIGGLVGLLVWMSIHNKKIRVRYVTKNGSFVIDDKARRKNVDGVEYWSLLKMKLVVSPPPSAAINMTNKGKLMAECYLKEGSQEPAWIIDGGPEEGFDTAMLTTQERALLIQRVIKATQRRRKGLLDTIAQIATPIALVMVVIVMLVFWENIAEPAKDMAQINTQMMESNKEISEQNARMVSVLAGKLDVGELTVTQAVPPDGGSNG